MSHPLIAVHKGGMVQKIAEFEWVAASVMDAAADQYAKLCEGYGNPVETFQTTDGAGHHYHRVVGSKIWVKTGR